MMDWIIRIMIIGLLLLLSLTCAMPFVRNDKKEELLMRIAFADVIILVGCMYFSLFINIIELIKK